MTHNKNALLIRIDRIGDLILTLPADEQKSLIDYDCHWCISKGLGFVADAATPKRRYSEWTKAFSWEQFFSFYRHVRQLKPEIAISFHAPWWVHLVLFLSRVPQRIGVLSKWHSFLFLNKAIRQKRSQCQHHEMEYNHQLVTKALGSNNTDTPHLKLKPTQPVPAELPEKFVLIHPGMSGSAKNWSLDNYSELITRLSKKTMIVITGTKSDRFILEPLKNTLPNENIMWLNEKLSGQELIAVASKAQAAFVPSTGVIHVAASLGIPTLGIYSPVLVQRAERWGPKGTHVQTLTPQVDCPAHFKCLGSSCPHFDCMNLVKVEQVYDTILQHI